MELDSNLFRKAAQKTYSKKDWKILQLSVAEKRIVRDIVIDVRVAMEKAFREEEVFTGETSVSKERTKKLIAEAEESVRKIYCGELDTDGNVFEFALAVRRSYSGFVGVQTKRDNWFSELKAKFDAEYKPEDFPEFA